MTGNVNNASFPKAGKIQQPFFKEFVFPHTGASRPEVLLGPAYGVDVSMVDLGTGMALLMTSDPLSLIPTLGLQESAWLSVQLMANDMATTGFAPQYAQYTLNLPPSLSEADFCEYWQYIDEYSRRCGAAITGGHTGRFEGQNSTVAGGGTMVTVAPRQDVLTSAGAKPGDSLILTKSAGLVALSILALSFPNFVTRKLGGEICREVSALFYETSALEAGLAVGRFHTVHKVVSAMHDVTEGGVLGAVYELAQASGCGFEIEKSAIPTTDAQARIADLFGIDPHLCVGAGAMLIAVDPAGKQELISHLMSQGINATSIGNLTSRGDGGVIKNKGIASHLTAPVSDPYWSAFHQALAAGYN